MLVFSNPLKIASYEVFTDWLNCYIRDSRGPPRRNPHGIKHTVEISILSPKGNINYCRSCQKLHKSQTVHARASFA